MVACSAPSILSSKSSLFTSKPFISSVAAAPKNFSGFNRGTKLRSLSFAAPDSKISSRRSSFVANASKLPLVGNVAPDFEAEAVFDQEFINVKLSDYIGKNVFSHLAWVQTERKSGGLGDLNYLLISDVTKSISKSFEVLIHDQGIALRGLFIIDKEGVIQRSTINNLAIGRSVDETLRTLQALQYVQENPDEVCPAGWKPGDKSMKPDPKGSKEYFSAI